MMIGDAQNAQEITARKFFSIINVCLKYKKILMTNILYKLNTF